MTDDLIVVLSRRYSIINPAVPKSKYWFNEVLPALDDRRFKQMMRVTRTQFGLILSLIENQNVFISRNKQETPVATQLAVVLYRLGCSGEGGTIAKISTLFGLGDGGSVDRLTKRVFMVIRVHLS